MYSDFHGNRVNGVEVHLSRRILVASYNVDGTKVFLMGSHIYAEFYNDFGGYQSQTNIYTNYLHFYIIDAISNYVI